MVVQAGKAARGVVQHAVGSYEVELLRIERTQIRHVHFHDLNGVQAIPGYLAAEEFQAGGADIGGDHPSGAHSGQSQGQPSGAATAVEARPALQEILPESALAQTVFHQRDGVVVCLVAVNRPGTFKKVLGFFFSGQDIGGNFRRRREFGGHVRRAAHFFREKTEQAFSPLHGVLLRMQEDILHQGGDVEHAVQFLPGPGRMLRAGRGRLESGHGGREFGRGAACRIRFHGCCFCLRACLMGGKYFVALHRAGARL